MNVKLVLFTLRELFSIFHRIIRLTRGEQLGKKAGRDEGSDPGGRDRGLEEIPGNRKAGPRGVSFPVILAYY